MLLLPGKMFFVVFYNKYYLHSTCVFLQKRKRFSLCLIKYHTMTWGSGGTVPCVFNTVSRWCEVVRIVIERLYVAENTPGTADWRFVLSI